MTTVGEKHLRSWTRWSPLTTFVYVLQAIPDTPIKVGFAHDVYTRIATLQTGNARRLRIVAVVPAPQRLETWFHRLLEPNRMVGEWFDGSGVPPFLENVERMATAMLDDYEGDAEVPVWTQYVGWLPYKIRRGVVDDLRDQAVTVRFVEPRAA